MDELYYPCSENNGADQLHGYCEADLNLYFCEHAECWFSRGVPVSNYGSKTGCQVFMGFSVILFIM